MRSQHSLNHREFLKRLRKHGVKVHADKYRFSEPALSYLGHRIDLEGDIAK